MELAIINAAQSSQHGDPEPLPCRVPAHPGSRLAFSWGSGCQLHVAEVMSPSTRAGGQQPFAGSCDWGSLSAAQRRIAYQVLPVYTRLQQGLLRADTPERNLRQSYSDAVYDALMEYNMSLQGAAPENEEDLQLAYEAALWHLLDLFFLSYGDLEGGVLPEALAGWVLQHGNLFDGDAPGFNRLRAQAEELLQDPRVDTNAAFWPTLQRLVLLGQLEPAMALLAPHPLFQASGDEGMGKLAQGFDAVFQLLRTLPRLDRSARHYDAVRDAGGAWSDDVLFNQDLPDWEEKVVQLYHTRQELLEELNESDPAAAKGLAGLLLMLCPDFKNVHPEESPAVKHMAKVCWNWVELLTAMLLWQYRLLPVIELRGLVEVAVKLARPRHTDRDFQDFFAKLMLACCQQEVQEVIALCTNSRYSSLQFVVHSFELLRALPDANRVISRPLPHMGCDQAESFLLNYVEVLQGAAATWSLAAEYLAWCPVYGADALEALLDTCPFILQDQQAALKALALARRHDLTAASYGLCKRLAAAATQSGQLAAALQWALQAHDPQLCAELVAPLVVELQEQLLAQVESFQAAPLELPALQDLEPLLLNLPDSMADPVTAAASGQQQRSATPQRQRYPELHFLRAMLHLQEALQKVHSCQHAHSSVGAKPGGKKSTAEVGASTGVSQQQALDLQAAYAGVQGPVQELLLDGVAPAALQLPLLMYIAPILDSTYMPFSRGQVMGLLRVMQCVSNGLPSVAAAVLAGSHGSLPGVTWPHMVAKEGPAAVNAARLALCRALSRANVAENSVQAW